MSILHVKCQSLLFLKRASVFAQKRWRREKEEKENRESKNSFNFMSNKIERKKDRIMKYRILHYFTITNESIEK